MKGVRLSELTWPEAAAAIQTHPLAVIPVGAESFQLAGAGSFAVIP